MILRSTSPRMNSTLQVPSNAWDSHMHVLDPENFPLDVSAVYNPKPRLLLDATNFEASLGIPKLVLVQPSIYGNDNSCLESSLRQLGPKRARGVVTFDPYTVDERQLKYWHELGVRGVRLNLSSTKIQLHPARLRILLQTYAKKIRPFNWALQLYMPLSKIEELEDIIPTLGIKIVLDHFGHPDFSNATLLRSSVSSTLSERRPSSSGSTSSGIATKSAAIPQLDTSSVPGLPSLLRLFQLSTNSVTSSKLYIKLSAPYRLFPREKPGYSNPDHPCWVSNPFLEAYTKLLLQSHRSASRYLLFATDWPFTRFDGINIRPFIEDLKLWCYEVAQEQVETEGSITLSGQDITVTKEVAAVRGIAQELIDDIFRNAAEDLWDVPETRSRPYSQDEAVWTGSHPARVELQSSM